MNVQNIVFRPATVSDAQEIAQVMIEVQQQAYSGILPDYLLARVDIARAQKHHEDKLQDTAQKGGCTYVAETTEKRVIGFASGGPKRDGPDRVDGELYNIFVLTEYQGLKVGSVLFLKVVEFLQAHHYSSLLLWSIRTTAASGYYLHLGGQNTAERDEKIANVDVILDCYSWENLSDLYKILRDVSHP